MEAGTARCECESGWAGADCSTPTTASTFHLHSFVRLALSFSPLGYTTSISLRYSTPSYRSHFQIFCLISLYRSSYFQRSQGLLARCSRMFAVKNVENLLICYQNC
ncbi:Neural-cadherin [Portunus trituberculatus]|uniref:Neural-cadherin n=1 Tax=Portunus trituberculatus TaxID=210409 RepID=A0A5B7J130_PORTR|nr:Neural-cadherin [Portunus trituberculatus]